VIPARKKKKEKAKKKKKSEKSELTIYEALGIKFKPKPLVDYLDQKPEQENIIP